MNHDWEHHGIWVQARVARSFVQRSGTAVHGWVRWADGTYGSFQGQSAQDVTGRFPTGSIVDVLVDPSKRLRNYRMALEGSADGPIDRSYAEPADEPAVASGLLNAFSGGTGGYEKSPASEPGPGAAKSGPPQPAASPGPPMVVAVVLLAIGLATLWLFARAGITVQLLLPAAFCLMGLGLLISVLQPMLALSALRRTGQRVPATVLRSREVLDSGGRSARFRWQVVAEATIAGRKVELLSETLRGNPADALPPGTMLTALVNPDDPTRYRLLLSG